MTKISLSNSSSSKNNKPMATFSCLPLPPRKSTCHCHERGIVVAATSFLRPIRSDLLCLSSAVAFQSPFCSRHGSTAVVTASKDDPLSLLLYCYGGGPTSFLLQLSATLAADSDSGSDLLLVLQFPSFIFAFVEIRLMDPTTGEGETCILEDYA